MALQRSTTIIEEQEKVELFLSCRKLKNMDYFSLTDPQVKLYIERNGQYVLFGQTEMIQDNLNPNFTKSFILDYYFEVKQKLKFEVIDIDGPNQTEFVGEVLTTLGEIVGSKKQTAIFDIMNRGEKTGKLVIQCEKVARNNSSLFIEFHGSNLKNVEGFFGKSNPVLKLSRAAGDSGYVVIYESEVISKNLNPIWKPFEIKVQKLCNGDYYRPIKAEVFSRSGYKDKIIGECQFTLNDLKEQEMRAFTVVNKVKNSKDGILKIKQFSIVEKPDFLDYLRGGVQLSVILAIDFTGSNGDPSFPNSLHALKYDGTMNEYQKAIQGVCDILLNYDYDKKIPVYGFGGKPKYQTLYSNTVQHCFPVNGNPSDPWCSGLDGIMQTYAFGLQNVELSGPTLFAPILQQAMRVAQLNKSNGSNEYTILLIITDGEIHDMEPTINCLIKSAHLPLSVIIVGVGNADFSNMEILDGDEGLSNSNGVKAERDLVQFVPFRNFQGSHEMLAKHVLEEVPDQLVEYMTRAGIRPQAAQEVDINTLFKRQATIGDAPINSGGANPSFGQPGPGPTQQMPMAPPGENFGAGGTGSMHQIPATNDYAGPQQQVYGQPMSLSNIPVNTNMYNQFGQPTQQTQPGILRSTTLGANGAQQNVQLNFMNNDANKQLRGGFQTMGPGPYGGNY